MLPTPGNQYRVKSELHGEFTVKVFGHVWPDKDVMKAALDAQRHGEPYVQPTAISGHVVEGECRFREAGFESKPGDRVTLMLADVELTPT